MKKCNIICSVLSLIVIGALAISNSCVFAYEKNVHQLHTYDDIGNQLKILSILKGDENGDLKSEELLTREDAVVLLSRMYGVEEEAKKFRNVDMNFSDVSEDNPYFSYIQYASHMGWTNGVDPTTFGFRQKVDAKQFLTFMMRVLKYDVDWTKEDVIQKATQLKLTEGFDLSKDMEFKRGSAFILIKNTLDANINGLNKTLLQELQLAKKTKKKEDAERGVFALSRAYVSGNSTIRLVFSDEIHSIGKAQLKISGRKVVGSELRKIAKDECKLILPFEVKKGEEFELIISGFKNAKGMENIAFELKGSWELSPDVKVLDKDVILSIGSSTLEGDSSSSDSNVPSVPAPQPPIPNPQQPLPDTELKLKDTNSGADVKQRYEVSASKLAKGVELIVELTENAKEKSITWQHSGEDLNSFKDKKSAVISKAGNLRVEVVGELHSKEFTKTLQVEIVRLPDKMDISLVDTSDKRNPNFSAVDEKVGGVFLLLNEPLAQDTKVVIVVGEKTKVNGSTTKEEIEALKEAKEYKQEEYEPGKSAMLLFPEEGQSIYTIVYEEKSGGKVLAMGEIKSFDIALTNRITWGEIDAKDLVETPYDGASVVEFTRPKQGIKSHKGTLFGDVVQLYLIEDQQKQKLGEKKITDTEEYQLLELSDNVLKKGMPITVKVIRRTVESEFSKPMEVGDDISFLINFPKVGFKVDAATGKFKKDSKILDSAVICVQLTGVDEFVENLSEKKYFEISDLNIKDLNYEIIHVERSAEKPVRANITIALSGEKKDLMLSGKLEFNITAKADARKYIKKDIKSDEKISILIE